MYSELVIFVIFIYLKIIYHENKDVTVMLSDGMTHTGKTTCYLKFVINDLLCSYFVSHLYKLHKI